MTKADRVKLLFGPYRPPRLRRGDRAFCLLRDCDVTVTSWTAARIPWPRCCAPGTHGGGSGILLDDELARAVRHASAAAVCPWWGVSDGVVSRWRRALGIGRAGTEGSWRLIHAAATLGGAAVRERGLTPDQIERRRVCSRALDLARYLRPGYHGPRWTRQQLALLATLPDEEVARRTGRTPNAVRVMRRRLRIPKPRTSPGTALKQS
jgi:hypothetical protein